MTVQADPWARDWLKCVREKGATGITLEKIHNVHCIKWATTVWDKGTKKKKKLSNYIGTLDPPGYVRISRDIDIKCLHKGAVDALTAIGVDLDRYRDEDGNEENDPESKPLDRLSFSQLLYQGPCLAMAATIGSSDFKALKTVFKGYADDLYMLAMARVCGRGRLKDAGGWFLRQENVLSINPHSDPFLLSDSLRAAGAAVHDQARFFDIVRSDGSTMAADMTFVFSKSGKASLAKKGYNRFKLSCGQYNMVFLCDLEDRMPHSVMSVPGNVRENSFLDMLRENRIGRGITLVMDRGYYSETLMDELHLGGYRFVVPVRRDSPLYGKVCVDVSRGFDFMGSAVCWGREDMGYWAIRYQNFGQRNDELSTEYGKAEKLAAERESADGWLSEEDDYDEDAIEKAGNLILVTNVNEGPKEVYSMFKLRCGIEQCIDSAKNDLEADSAYLQSNEGISGYGFVTLLSLRIWMSLMNRLSEAGLHSKMDPRDLLFEYEPACSALTDDGYALRIVPASVREIDKKVGLNLYP